MKQSSTGLISGQPASRRHDKSERARPGGGGVGGGGLQTSSAVSFTQTVAKTGKNLRVYRHVS